MKRCEFWVALPDSTLSETPHLRDKTVKTGMISRVCAVFGVEMIYLYRDLQGVEKGDLRLMKTLLEYMELPQYLRKRVYGKSTDLAYAGLLPPLRTPHHKLGVQPSSIKAGEYRDGAVVKVKGSTYVDCGLASLVPLEGEVRGNTRVTVCFTSTYPNLRCRVAEKSELKEYWGYRVKEAASLAKLLSDAKPDLLIFTSRRGEPIQSIWSELVRGLKNANSLMLVFGSPRRGVFEILGDEEMTPRDYSKYVVNSIPSQATETARSEEALLATLSLMNLATHL